MYRKGLRQKRALLILLAKLGIKAADDELNHASLLSILRGHMSS